jgi:Streptomyces sporulation and cell division protein, SsgA
VRAVRSETLAHGPDRITFEVPPRRRVTDRLAARLLGVTSQPMSRVLTQDLTLQCIDPWGRPLDLPASFGYDPADPWAVWITFRSPNDEVRWAVGRDLLLQGLTDPAGEGDIRLWPSIDEDGRAAVVMELCSPAGQLVAQLRTSELYRFLTRSLAAVPRGTEWIDLDLMVASLAGPSEAE